MLAPRNKRLSENTGRKSARCRHSATYLFVPSSTQLHARVIESRRQAVPHPHRVVHAVWLLVYREVAHVRPRGHGRAHRRARLQLWLGLVLVWVVVLRMMLDLGILWRLLLVLVMMLLVLMLVLMGMR